MQDRILHCKAHIIGKQNTAAKKDKQANKDKVSWKQREGKDE